MGVIIVACYGAHSGAWILYIFLGNKRLWAFCYLALLWGFSDIILFKALVINTLAFQLS